jgi:hypothetical protein
MGGKGEAVLYKRIRATTKKQRDKLKKQIRDLVDNTVTPISIIALVEEEGGKKRKRKRGR